MLHPKVNDLLSPSSNIPALKLQSSPPLTKPFTSERPQKIQPVHFLFPIPVILLIIDKILPVTKLFLESDSALLDGIKFLNSSVIQAPRYNLVFTISPRDVSFRTDTYPSKEDSKLFGTDDSPGAPPQRTSH